MPFLVVLTGRSSLSDLIPLPRGLSRFAAAEAAAKASKTCKLRLQTYLKKRKRPAREEIVQSEIESGEKARRRETSAAATKPGLFMYKGLVCAVT